MKKMSNLKWMALFAVICLFCLLTLLLFRLFSGEGRQATVAVNGRPVRTVDLTGEPFEFEIQSEDGGFNRLRAENGKIAVIDADCPDKLCVRRGYISAGDVPIVCLPHRLSVQVGSESAVDGVVGGQ